MAFSPARNIKPTNREYRLDPESFIYCANSGCPLARTGLCRISQGPDAAKACRRCNKSFPTKPNGAKWVFAHRQALLDGKPSAAPARPAPPNERRAKQNTRRSPELPQAAPDRLDRLTNLLEALINKGAQENTATQRILPPAAAGTGGNQSNYGHWVAQHSPCLLHHRQRPILLCEIR